MKIIVSLFIFVFATQAGATLLPAELNRCKPRTEKSKSEEVIAREAAEGANLNDHEVFGRLLLSEAAASGMLSKRCNASNIQALMEAMGWVVITRVEKLSPDKDDPNPDAFYNVIFEPGQFRTSFSSAGSNPYAKIFLCPIEIKSFLPQAGTGLEGAVAMYKQAKEVAARIMETYQKSGIPSENARINSYFFPYAEQVNAQRPKWAKNADPTKNKGYVDLLKVAAKPCAEFYRLK
jgi:hypothetical protein